MASLKKPLIIVVFAGAFLACKSGQSVATKPAPSSEKQTSKEEEQPETSSGQTAERDDALLGIEATARGAAKTASLKGLITIRSRGKVVYSESFGVDADPSTRFPIGSLTKAFTAFLTLKLADQGKLDLSRPLGEVLDGAPKAWQGITPEMLLGHTGGLPEVTAAPDYFQFFAAPHTTRELLDYIAKGSAQFPAGSQFEYSNSGYIMLSYLIERQSGKTLADNLRDEIFLPAKMKDSTLGGDGDVEAVTNDPKVVLTNTSGAGGIVSTAEDLGLWHDFLQARSGLKPARFDAMYKPGKGEYGQGWYVTTIEGQPVIHHSGLVNGYNHELARFEANDILVTILSNVNQEAVGQVMEALVRKIASSL